MFKKMCPAYKMAGLQLMLSLMFVHAAAAQPWVTFDGNTRYMALGDSLSAGYAAKPATQGFVFKLYQMGVIDNLNNMLFCAAAIPNATSTDVLTYQIPQVHLFFKDTGSPYRKVITLTVGGNDAFSVVKPDGTVDIAAIPAMLANYGQNLTAILGSLVSMSDDVQVYVGNLYDPKLPIAGSEVIVGLMNQVTLQVTTAFTGRVVLVDIYSAFQGRKGLLLIEKHAAEPDQIHPTDAGYNVMAKAFADAIGRK